VTGPVMLREPAYRVKVALARQSIDAFGREVALQPDMTLSADIILEKRSLLEWLFEPLFSARGRLS
jgi:membrane fusion protein